MSYQRPGHHTEDYVSIIGPLLAGEAVDHHGQELSGASQSPRMDSPAPLLLAALGPRLLRVAGEAMQGTITWIADAEAVRSHVGPTISAAAARAGRPAPRIVVGVPVAVHDDEAEASETAATQFAVYGQLPNYQRILERGRAEGPGSLAIVGTESVVADAIAEVFHAGATDVWAAPFVVGTDRAGSRADPGSTPLAGGERSTAVMGSRDLRL